MGRGMGVRLYGVAAPSIPGWGQIQTFGVVIIGVEEGETPKFPIPNEALGLTARPLLQPNRVGVGGVMGSGGGLWGQGGGYGVRGGLWGQGGVMGSGGDPIRSRSSHPLGYPTPMLWVVWGIL